MHGEFQSRTALVTGGSRGIGAACAKALASEGARVAVVARSKALLDELVEEIGPQARAIECDLSQAGAAERLVERVRHEVGEIDILVNNAGMSLSKPIDKIREADIDALFAMNVRSATMLCSSVIRSMRAGGRGGAIVNISSGAAIVGSPYLSVYGATKAALDGLTRSLACEVGPENIRVNSVLPGFIVTDMWDRGRQIPGIVEAIEQKVALRRWGTPDDIADVVGFLCSSRARYITGVCLSVDGGYAQMSEILPRR